MNIGIVIGRIGGVDGVALETEKWMTVAERMGHNCFLLAGKLEAEFKNATVLPELFFYHPDCAQGQDDAFFIQKADEKEFLDRLEKETEYIERNILKWIMSKINISYIFTK